jgi:ketosteroid isomerase-like protein
MDNPLGGIKRGWNEISDLYRGIFNGSAEVYVEFFDYTVHEHGDVFYAVGRERGFFQQGQKHINLAVRTSRIFRRVNDRWRQIHHHGSIEDPDMLAAYQSAVLGGPPTRG